MSDRIKHGTVDDSTGLVFWSYEQNGKQRWLTKEKFDLCKIKSRESQRRNYWKNPEQSRKKLMDWHNSNKDKKSKAFKNWSTKNKDRLRGTRLLRQYGISNETYIEMFESQLGLCAICGESQQGITKDGESRFLCIDHCHSTGKVRELLCARCNAGLGQFKDNPDLLINASKYLIKHQTQGMNQQ